MCLSMSKQLVKTHSPAKNMARNFTKTQPLLSTNVPMLVKAFTCFKYSKNLPKKSDLEEHKCAQAGKNQFTCSKFESTLNKNADLEEHKCAHAGKNTFTWSKFDKKFDKILDIY